MLFHKVQFVNIGYIWYNFHSIYEPQVSAIL